MSKWTSETRERYAFDTGLAPILDGVTYFYPRRIDRVLGAVSRLRTLAQGYAGSVEGVLRALGNDAVPAAPRMQRQSDARSDAFAWRYLREAQTRLIAPTSAR